MKRLSLPGMMAMGGWWALAGAAHAQDIGGITKAQPNETAAEVVELEEITITATRVAREGFLAPTPTLVLQPEQLRQGGRSDLFSALNDLPQFNNIWGPQAVTNDTAAGFSVIDLRGLGSNRTLTLIDGRRPAPTGENIFNLAFIPFNLIERVEVVTGGASAAWGSGAVSGVVNVILNNNLQGLYLNGQYGISSRGDGDEFSVSGAFGASFADGRGHFMIGAEYVDNNGIYSKNARPWGRGRIIVDPTGEFDRLWTENSNWADASPGGLIVFSGTALSGTEFGPGGVPRPFQYGSPRDSFEMIGGGGVYPGDFEYLSAPLTRGNVYARGSYELLPSLTLTADVLYARSQVDFPATPQIDTYIRIQQDNAFLPERIRQIMIANNRTSFLLGRINTEEGLKYNYKAVYESIQGNVGLQGDLGGDFTWDAYVGYGRSDIDQEMSNQRFFGRFEEAVDSVIGPDGTPICRSGNPACFPFNPFGVGSPSTASIAYFSGTSFKDTVVKQHIAAATIRGEPFSTWAGPVSIAAGVEWRRNKINSLADPLSVELAPFDFTNFSNLRGTASAKEAFGEAVVPLAKDMPLLHLLELNGAVRVSDYSNSGTITSWKVGVSYEPIDGLRFRATRSRDQRAPDLCELFCQQSITVTVITDPFRNDEIRPVTDISGGNPDLGIEASDTLTFGAILRPSFVPGLSLSVDYYDIKIKDVIAAIDAQSIINRCFEGNQSLCDAITRNGAGQITQVSSQAVNVATFQTNGIDAELVYTTSLSGLVPGQLTLRGNVNWVDEVVYEDPLIDRRDLTDNLRSFDSVPHWRGLASVRYETDRLGIDLRARYIGSGIYYEPALNRTINDNHIESRTYFDLGLDYQLIAGDDAHQVELYANVANLFDKRPPFPYSRRQHDLIGRYLTAGVRMKF